MSKRRRVSPDGSSRHDENSDDVSEDDGNDDDNELALVPAPHPDGVVSSAALPVAATVAAPEQPQLADPVLGEIPQLVVVDLHKDNTQDVVNALTRLRNLMIGENEYSEKNRQEAYSIGAHHAVVVTLRKWQHNERIQSHGCCFLLLVVAENMEAARALVKMGGIEAAVRAMQLFPNSEPVQRRACFAVMNIFYFHEDDNAVQQAMDRFANALDGIGLVLKAMEKFIDSARLQKAGCGIFCNLSAKQGLRNAMIKAGVVCAVGAALKHHDDKKDLKNRGSICMTKLFAK